MQTMKPGEATKYLRQATQIEDMLEPAENPPFYICPKCGSGTGPKKTGAMQAGIYNGKQYAHCHACEVNFNIFSLYAYTNGMWDGEGKMDREIFERAREDMARTRGITIEYPPARNGTQPAHQAEPPSPEGNRKPAPAAATHQEQKPPKDWTDYQQECARRLDTPEGKPGRDYFNARGISTETARAAGCGYDPKARGGPRVTSPAGKYAYNSRKIAPGDEWRWDNPKDGEMEPFNLSALWDADNTEGTAIFITEGLFDALSYLEAEVKAIALNGTGQKKKLVKALKEKATAATLVIDLDSDGPGQKAAAELRQDLDRAGVRYIDHKIPDGYKDANEFLTGDRTAFFIDVRKAVERLKRPDGVADYIANRMWEDMKACRDPIQTGFPAFDREAGGLYSGLYCLAANSSIGKTTFCTQIADQIAATGQDVLYFSMEQSKLEIVTKSIARRLAQKRGSDTRPRGRASGKVPISSKQISHVKGLRPDDLKEVQSTIKEYSEEIGNRFSIIEGNFGSDVNYIENYIIKHCRRTGSSPVVIIDYLQILDPGLDAMKRPRQIREAIDECVKRLKTLSRQQGLTVIVISSVNRANYYTEIDMDSLKESGLIEYTCDVIYGMQFACMKEDIFDKPACFKAKKARIAEAKRETPRKIELKCLKNRYGWTGWKIGFDYFPGIDLFKETGLVIDSPEKPEKQTKKIKRKDVFA